MTTPPASDSIEKRSPSHAPAADAGGQAATTRPAQAASTRSNDADTTGKNAQKVSGGGQLLASAGASQDGAVRASKVGSGQHLASARATSTTSIPTSAPRDLDGGRLQANTGGGAKPRALQQHGTPPAESSSQPSGQVISSKRVSQAPLAAAHARARASPRFRRSSSLPSRATFSVPRYLLENPSAPRPRSKLIGVPATLADIEAGAPTRDGEDGIERLIEGSHFSERDFADLARIVKEDVRCECLHPGAGDLPPSEFAGPVSGLAASGARILREVLPALRYFGVGDFSRRVLSSVRHMQLVLTHVRALEELVGDPQAIQAAEWLTESRRLGHEIRNQREYTQDRIDFVRRYCEDQHKKTLKAERQKYQDQLREKERRIQQLEIQAAECREQTDRAEAASALLQSRLTESRLPDPWALIDFFREFGHLRGNWQRLLALLEHYRDGTAPPSDWISRVDVDDLKATDYVVPPFPSREERAARAAPDPASSTVRAAPARDTPAQAAKTPGSSTRPKFPAKSLISEMKSSAAPVSSKASRFGVTPVSVSGRARSNSILDLSPGSHTVVKSPPASRGLPRVASGDSSPNFVDLTTPSSTPKHSQAPPQRRPCRYVGGDKGTRGRHTPYKVSLNSAQAGLPRGVRWDAVRADMQELMRFGSTYHEALELVQRDTALHTQFRRRELLPMLQSMAYWHSMDSTPWVRNVPEQLLDLAIEQLSKRNDEPPYWPPLPLILAESPDEPLSPLPGAPDSGGGDYDSFGPDFSSLSSHGDTGDEDFLDALNSKRKPSKQGGSASKKPRSRASQALQAQPVVPYPTTSWSVDSVTFVPTSQFHLVRKSLKTLTAEEKDMIEIPASSDLSWRYFGIRVQRQPIEDNVPQNVNFPSFVPVRTHTFELEERWDPRVYEILMGEKPWDKMYESRVTELYFHTVDSFSPSIIRELARFNGFMADKSREFWDAGHWIPIVRKELESRRLHTDRKNRRGAFTEELEIRVRALEKTEGFVPTLWYEPGLWVAPIYPCTWIWRDASREPDILQQLRDLDAEEPVRAQWTTRRNDEAFLQLIPADLRARALTPAERRRNLLPTM